MRGRDWTKPRAYVASLIHGRDGAVIGIRAPGDRRDAAAHRARTGWLDIRAKGVRA